MAVNEQDERAARVEAASSPCSLLDGRIIGAGPLARIQDR
jgi:hypothetical protein